LGEGETQRAETAHRQAADASKARLRLGPKTLIDGPYKLDGDGRGVIARSAHRLRIDVPRIAAAIWHHDDHWRDAAIADHAVERLAQLTAVQPLEMIAVLAMQEVKHGIAPIARFIAGRQIERIEQVRAEGPAVHMLEFAGFRARLGLSPRLAIEDEGSE